MGLGNFTNEHFLALNFSTILNSTMKHIIYLGLSAGALSGLLGWLFVYAYQEAMWTSFSSVLNFQSIFGASMVGCILMSLGANIWTKIFDQKYNSLLNLVLLGLSLATFAGPLLSDLPLDIESPELFPGAALPLHLFPVVCWLSLKPIFESKK